MTRILCVGRGLVKSVLLAQVPDRGRVAHQSTLLPRRSSPPWLEGSGSSPRWEWVPGKRGNWRHREMRNSTSLTGQRTLILSVGMLRAIGEQVRPPFWQGCCSDLLLCDQAQHQWGRQCFRSAGFGRCPRPHGRRKSEHEHQQTALEVVSAEFESSKG